MSDERRKTPRLPWIKFESKVKVRRSLFSREWVEIVPFDYSKYGMGIQTDEVFELNDVIHLSIYLEMELVSVKLGVVPSVVRYREKHYSRFNYGIEFDYSSKYLSKKSSRADLEYIEQIINKYQQGSLRG